MQLHFGGQRPRSGGLQLDHGRSGPGGVHRLLERIEVGAQQVDATALIAPGPGGHPVTRRNQLNGEVDEQSRGAPDDVRTGAPIGQLGQVR